MPRFHKLSPAEIAALERPLIGTRTQVAGEYDAYLADFAAGDYGRADLAAGERRAVVRGRLQAAARRRGLALHFRPGPGPLTFHVDAAPAVTRPTSQEPVGAARVAAPRDETARRDPAPPRPPRRRPTAAERYHQMLPRWMREGQPPGRRGDSKRRHGR